MSGDLVAGADALQQPPEFVEDPGLTAQDGAATRTQDLCRAIAHGIERVLDALSQIVGNGGQAMSRVVFVEEAVAVRQRNRCQ